MVMIKYITSESSKSPLSKTARRSCHRLTTSPCIAYTLEPQYSYLLLPIPLCSTSPTLATYPRLSCPKDDTPSHFIPVPHPLPLEASCFHPCVHPAAVLQLICGTLRCGSGCGSGCDSGAGSGRATGRGSGKAKRLAWVQPAAVLQEMWGTGRPGSGRGRGTAKAVNGRRRRVRRVMLVVVMMGAEKCIVPFWRGLVVGEEMLGGWS